ncbi:MAG: hypothetical protein IJK04_03135 [Kiritimatiellae bacterium]|nr:hypothetical protein [Kiritimatiellia bacterium]
MNSGIRCSPTGRTAPRAVLRLVELRIDERPFASGTLAMRPPFGLSYLHLQTLAEEADPEGTYIRRLLRH